MCTSMSSNGGLGCSLVPVSIAQDEVLFKHMEELGLFPLLRRDETRTHSPLREDTTSGLDSTLGSPALLGADELARPHQPTHYESLVSLVKRETH